MVILKIEKIYERLFPEKKKGLAVIWLYERVKNGEFEHGIFKEKDTPAGKCFTVDDILSDPQAWENDFLRKIHYDNGVDGIVTDTPVRFQSMGLPPLEQSKPIGYHTEEILSQYGYTQEQLDEMKRSGAIVVKHHNCE